MMSSKKLTIIEKTKKFFTEKWRVLLFSLIVLFSIVFFLFGLGFSTNIAKAENTGSKEIIAIVQEIQGMNNELVVIGSIGVIFILLNIMLSSHNRKKYYLSNYIGMGGMLLTLAYGSIRMFQHISTSIKLLEKSFVDLKTYWEILFIRNQRSDITLEGVLDWFRLGNVVAILTLVGVICIGTLITVAVMILPKIKAREEEVKILLEKVENGEIKVSEKVVNLVPTLDVELDLLETEDFEEKPYNKTEKLRYRKNGSAYGLTLLSLLFFLLALFNTITYDTYLAANDRPRVMPSEHVAIDIVLAIGLTLMTFLAAEKVKIYDKKWSIGLFVISGINLLRIFYIPLNSLNNGSVPQSYFIIQILIPMIISIALTVAAGVISYIKTNKLQAFLKELGEK